MRCSLVVILVLGLTAHAAAQSLTTGAVAGVVSDADTGEPLGGVTVTVGTMAAITESDGTYKITELLPGTYDVSFVFDTTSVVRSGVLVSPDQVTNLPQKLKIGEAIHVEGPPPPIDTVDTAHKTRVDRRYLEGVPVPGTKFTAALGAIGGSQNDGVGVAFSGSTSLENRYLVDGIDITGLTFGDVGTPVLNEFIQEMEVISGGYNAEYGRSTGGIVNIVTRSGTDTLRGSIFGVVTPGLLTAAARTTPVNASSIDVTANRAYSGNIGFEVGGPIKKGFAWFYVGVSPERSRTDYSRTTKRLTDCRKRLDSGELSSCERGNADGEADVDPHTGFYITDTLDSEIRSATTQATHILAKLNVAAAAGHQAQVSLIAMPSSSESPGLYGLPTSGQRSHGLTTDGAARWTSKFAGGATELEAVIAWHRSTHDTGSLDPSLDAQPLQVLEQGSLGTWSALGGESAATARGCADQAADDPYPLIGNCPMTSRTYAIGGPGPIAHDWEERRTARVSATERVRAFGGHELKAGLDIEDATKSTARLFSGGAYLENLVGGSVLVHRWVQLAAPGDTDPRFDQTCTTPDPSGGGLGTGGNKSFRCSYLGGTLGAPGTQIGGETASWAAYLRDSWQPIPSVTINAGLRYEEQRLRYAEHLRGTLDPLTGATYGDTAMRLTGNFAPRLGAIWDPTREGRAKVYAHWGRFFEAIPMDINDRSFGGEVSDLQTFAASACGATDPRIGGPDGVGCLTSTKPHTEQLIGSSGVLVAPGIQAEYMDEVLAGAELAVIPNVVVGLTLQHRRLGRVIEDVSTDGANTYIIANPGESKFRGVDHFDKPVRDYDAIELSVGRRMATGLYLQGSYTYSRADGNYPGSVSYDNGQIDPNISSQYDLIELLANRRGRLPQDRPHSLKIDATYSHTVGHKSVITVGTRVRAISGVPENVLGPHYLYGVNESFLLPRGTLGRTELEHAIDVHLAVHRLISHDVQAELFVDVFNIYDRQGTFNVDETYAPYGSNVNPISGGTYDDLVWAKQVDMKGMETSTPVRRNPNFGRPTARYAPTSAQVGFRVTF